MADREFGFGTLCLHAGHIPDPATGSRAVPIYQTTSYVFDSADHAASLFNLQTFGNVYSRISNPTVAVFEERMAALEGGRAALATASGQAAQMCALLTLLRQGDEIVSASTLYGGTYSQFDVTFRQFGINTVFVDPDDPDNFRKALTPRTKVLYAETMGNPRINVLDIEAVAMIARDAGVPLVIDNTFASPYLCQPIRFGADIIVHSATKFIGGHGTTMGGVIVESGKFPWGNGKFPMMTEPSRGYHGVIFHETFGDFGYTMKCRMETLRTLGPALSPLNAWLLLQGLETLHVRMERHVQNATRVAEFLAGHPRVSWVNYPGLKTSPYYKLAQKYLPKGCGSIMTFGIKGGAQAGIKFIESLQFFSHLANVGDAKTLVIHPASTTHRQLSEEEQVKAGVSPDMVRLSIGIEDVDDILWDLDQALSQSRS
ncbi:MAG TPA: O-acetylhomoserine aminocarboxypropyltransferase/cysteine synthase family protein [Burkholderiales bacterium]|jgi:O-acetylhomoserine (thiol)-lyase|nr:O-acetylhomoserine aminocarboxypropyltransferase/cysteine synthase family protein [Burkholderiales bacterium]